MVTDPDESTTEASPSLGHDVFISYSRADRAMVMRFTEGLEARGLRPWVDLRDIPPSAEWFDEVCRAIEAADGVLVMVSRDLAASKVCAKELEHARTTGKRVVPVMVCPTDPAIVPDSLSSLNWIDATDGAFDQAIDRTVEALRTDLDHVRSHSKLLVRATEWVRKDASKALLLRGTEIAEAEGVVASGAEPRATPVQIRFVQASRAGATRRQRGVVAAVAAALIVSVGLSAFAIKQRGEAVEERLRAEEEARIALARQLSAQSLLKLGSEPDLAALLGLESYRVDPSLETLGTLLDMDHQREGLRWVRQDLPKGGWEIAVSPDGSHAFVVAKEGLTAWNAQTGTIAFRLPNVPRSRVFGATYSADGGSIVAVGRGGRVLVLDAASGATRSSDRPFPWVNDVAPAGRDTVAVAGGSRTIVYRVTASGQLAPVETIQAGASSLSGSPSFEGLALEQWGTYSLWRPSGGLRWTRQIGRSRETFGAAVHMGSLFITSSGRLEQIDLATGHVLERVRLESQGWGDPTISADRTRVAVATDDGIHVFDTRTLGEVKGSPLRGTPGVKGDVAYAGATLLALNKTGALEAWDAGAPDREPVLATPRFYSGLDFTADGALWAMDLRRVYELSEDSETAGSFPLPEGTFAATVNRTGTQVAVGTADGRVMLGDPTDQRFSTPLGAHRSRVWDVVFSQDGGILASGSRAGDIRLWDTQGHLLLGEPIDAHDDGVITLAFSPDGHVLASASMDGTARLFDVQSRRPIGAPLGPGAPPKGRTTYSGGYPSHWVAGLAFSPDGATLATSDLGGHLRFYRVWDGEQIGEIDYRYRALFAVAISPDGRTAAVAMDDSAIALVDIPSRTPLTEVGFDLADLTSLVAFSPDGSTLASTQSLLVVNTLDASAWERDIEALRRSICPTIGRNLTSEEWQTYLPGQEYRRTCPEFRSA
jgi:WD40 repeat protein